MYDIERST